MGWGVPLLPALVVNEKEGRVAFVDDFEDLESKAGVRGGVGWEREGGRTFAW